MLGLTDTSSATETTAPTWPTRPADVLPSSELGRQYRRVDGAEDGLRDAMRRVDRLRSALSSANVVINGADLDSDFVAVAAAEATLNMVERRLPRALAAMGEAADYLDAVKTQWGRVWSGYAADVARWQDASRRGFSGDADDIEAKLNALTGCVPPARPAVDRSLVYPRVVSGSR